MAPSKTGAQAVNEFLLQNSSESVGSRLQWWRLGGGYTTNVDEAEVFSRQAAVAQHHCRESDLPWPLDKVSPHTHTAVDCQYVAQQDLTCLPADTPCYVQKSRCWDGNDLYWITPEKSLSANLATAQVFTMADALLSFGGEANAASYVIWPKEYIDAKSRRVAHNATMSVQKALKGTGIELMRPRRRRRSTATCGGCGRFSSTAQIYSGACPHCDTDNRP